MCAGVEFFILLFLSPFADAEYIQKPFKWIFKDA
jgi:hypothetical protein